MRYLMVKRIKHNRKQTDCFMERTIEVIETQKIIAVIRLDDLSQAVPMCHALVHGGIRALEFTLTNAHAVDAVREVITALPQIASKTVIIGVGSATTPEQVKAAVDAGAQFVVSPHVDERVIKATVQAQVVAIPGALTPTEMMVAHHAGAHFVKVFPAPVFGPDYLKRVLAPLPHLKLMPSGGINRQNIVAYLDNGAVACGVGGDLIDPQIVAERDWNSLAERAHEFVMRVKRNA
jgi:2-dehydro-3-deoxyphosphogluconate aldolase/(4S)-4-hydroxy-2-oxoglutarate aldolase